MDNKSVLALSLLSLPWLEPPPLPGRGARDDDKDQVDDVNVVGWIDNGRWAYTWRGGGCATSS